MNSGTRLDQYELVAKIGEGGMGVVWRARDVSLDRDVAVKVLPASFTADAGRLARFEREAKVVAGLSHPNIVTIYGYGTSDEGITYAAMELLEGRSLRELLDEGPLPLRKGIEIARQIAAGLDAAHAQGVVHRDLKPDNVFITPDGRARILDFGLAGTGPDEAAGSGSDSGTRTRLTDPGTVVGTAAYMSPEQARGAETGPAADLFALGVMLHEMLGGRHPYQRETTAETLTAILREDPPPVTIDGRPAPPVLDRLVRRCLEKSPRERFQSARDLGFALESAVADSGSSGSAIAAPAAAPQGRQLPVAAVALALALAAVVAFAAGWWLRPLPPALDPPRISELTFTGSDYQPDVSPDGQFIAFTSARTGTSRIWLRQVEGGGEQPLTEGSDWRPRFAPDGQSVAFLRGTGSGFAAHRVSVLGGQPRKLLDNVDDVAWAPDGNRLAFLRGTGIGIVDLETGQERVVARYEEWALVGIDWSEDGRRLATTKASTQGGSGNWALVVIDLESDAAPTEISLGPNDLLSGPVWAGPDALLFARAPSTVSLSPLPNDILRVDLSSGEMRPLLYEPYLFPLRGAFTETVRISLLGSDRIVFDTHRQLQTIRELDLRDGSLRTFARGVSTDRQPAYSPDGRRIVFTSNRSGGVDLHAWDRETGALLQLTEHPASDWDPGFTPDGQSLLWSSDRTGNLEIWMSATDGSDPRRVTDDGFNAENPTMTANGEWIVYSSGNPEAPGLHRVRPDGTEVSRLVPRQATNPEVSHDGRYALFVVNDIGPLYAAIGVVEIATGELVDFRIDVPFRPESPNVTYGRGRWMPDDRAIAFIGADERGQPTVYIQDFVPGQDTAATRRKVPGIEAAGIIESFGISPDGNRFALSTIDVVRVLKMAEGLPPLR